MASERRRQRIAEVLKEEIAKILFREGESPEDVLVTVTRVGLSDDLEHANVSVSVFPDDATEDIFAVLERNAGKLQRFLNRRMRMRPVPKIRFVPEDRTANADRIEAELYRLQRDH